MIQLTKRGIDYVNTGTLPLPRGEGAMLSEQMPFPRRCNIPLYRDAG